MHGANGRRRQRLQREVAVGDGIDGIAGRPVEAERRGGAVAVEGKSGAGQGGGAQRRFVEPPPGVGEAAAVAGEHLHIGQQMVAEGDRLGALQMGETRHDRVVTGRRLCRQGRQQAMQLAVQFVDGVTHPQAQVGGHLIVARARRVQPAGGLADQFLQPRLDVHVDVFQGARIGKLSLTDL